MAESLQLSSENRRTAPLHIYANARTVTRIEAIFAALGVADCPHIFPREFHVLDDAGGETRVGPFDLVLIPTVHVGTPCLGLALRGDRRGLVYSADTEPLETIFGRLRPDDILIHECNDLTRDKQTGHTTWPQLRDRLPSLPPIALYLVHLPPVPAAVAAEIAVMPQVTLATDGLTIEF